ncbi:MAG: hypothetical protein C0403_06445 [Desulfobacterium sp.]|nr:hypothetical protein [Desulfobacterium sp.]
MKKGIKKSIQTVLVALLLVAGSGGGSSLAGSTDEAGISGKQDPEKTALMKRIDFGNSYIMGQSIKSGAVYLLQRKKSDISSMLKCRSDYRDEILEDFQFEELEKDRKTGSKKP